uniref:Pre-mRNA processing factor 39 n=1 Tax=Melopsittacus undulatus TaxID=13146 RepID=A0A8V5GPI7_MELUD
MAAEGPEAPASPGHGGSERCRCPPSSRPPQLQRSQRRPPPPSPRSPPRLRSPPPPVPAEEPPPSYPMDFERFWLAAQSNPHDFTAWTELLQFVEQENHLLAARKAFDAFFSHYPYCYGYWKKYADMERRFECARETEEVLGGGDRPHCPHYGGVWGSPGDLRCF